MDFMIIIWLLLTQIIAFGAGTKSSPLLRNLLETASKKDNSGGNETIIKTDEEIKENSETETIIKTDDNVEEKPKTVKNSSMPKKAIGQSRFGIEAMPERLANLLWRELKDDPKSKNWAPQSADQIVALDKGKGYGFRPSWSKNPIKLKEVYAFIKPERRKELENKKRDLATTEMLKHFKLLSYQNPSPTAISSKNSSGNSSSGQWSERKLNGSASMKLSSSTGSLDSKSALPRPSSDSSLTNVPSEDIRKKSNSDSDIYSKSLRASGGSSPGGGSGRSFSRSNGATQSVRSKSPWANNMQSMALFAIDDSTQAKLDKMEANKKDKSVFGL